MGPLTTFLVPMEGGEGGFESPGVHSFDTEALFGISWLDKYMLMGFVAFVAVLVFWLWMAGKRELVPSKSQHVGEQAYYFLRNSIARDIIGHDYQKFLPLLIALFSFVLVNNLFGIFPFTMLPTASHVGWAYGLAIVVWVVYNAAGIAKHGLGGYLHRTVLPPGVPWPLWIIVIPIEFLSNIIVRPVTLSLRLFANMFAGHLLVLVFVLGGEYLVLHSDSIVNRVAGVLSLVFSLAIFCLEVLVQCLQAYIFTVLTAQYISSSVAEEH